MTYPSKSIEYQVDKTWLGYRNPVDAEIIKLRKEGYTRLEIRKMVNREQVYVKKVLDSHGFPKFESEWFRKQGKKYIDYIKKHSGEHTSYWLRINKGLNQSDMATLTFKCPELWEDDEGYIYWGGDWIEKQPELW